MESYISNDITEKRRHFIGAAARQCQSNGPSIWLKDLNHPTLASAVFDYIEEMLAAGRVVLPPPGLQPHVYERFVEPLASEFIPLVESSSADGDGLERLDPVCLMAVDPATARHTVEYAGQTIAFCAPSCKKLFLADPQAYLVAS